MTPRSPRVANTCLAEAAGLPESWAEAAAASTPSALCPYRLQKHQKRRKLPVIPVDGLRAHSLRDAHVTGDLSSRIQT